jgi:hypothetical protein
LRQGGLRRFGKRQGKGGKGANKPNHVMAGPDPAMTGLISRATQQ